MKKLLVFDVEATSLHGIPLAVGALVMNGLETEETFELMSLENLDKCSDWVKMNVLPYLTKMKTCKTDLEMRTAFFNFYLKHKEDCEIYSDVNFPVETNFLSAVAQDNIQEREFLMPYPLKDISTIVDINIDRIKESKIPNLRKHHPVDDSYASAICLIKHLEKSKL